MTVYRGMFVQPWQVTEEPIEFAKRYEDLGCNMLTMNAVYHQCNILDVGSHHIHERRNAGASFAVHPKRYGRIKPHVEADLTETILRLREVCEQRGIDWRCWMVNLHNDEIGYRYPDAMVRNVWGDSYPSALCLNHPDVREYAVCLLNDVADTLHPSRVVLETESWMQAFHGRHHEFGLARITPAVQYLLSLCFCEHCMEAAKQAGVDAEKAKETTAMLLERLLKGDTTFGANEEAQLTQIFLEYPEIYAYQHFRMDTVTALVRETAQAVHDHGVLYELIPSAAPFIVNSQHFEGTSIRGVAPYVDDFVPLCYHPSETYPMLRKNIELFAPEAKVSMAMNLSRARYAGKAEFVGKIAEAAADGAENFYCYNYGMATEECLAWMREGYQALTQKG